MVKIKNTYVPLNKLIEIRRKQDPPKRYCRKCNRLTKRDKQGNCEDCK